MDDAITEAQALLAWHAKPDEQYDWGASNENAATKAFRLLAALVENDATLRADLARVEAERDARPAITREDARAWARHWDHEDERTSDDAYAVMCGVESALRAHAKGGADE